MLLRTAPFRRANNGRAWLSSLEALETWKLQFEAIPEVGQAAVARQAGKMAEEVALLERAVDICAVMPDDHPLSQVAELQLAMAKCHSGNFQDAIPLLTRLTGYTAPNTAEISRALALCHLRLGDSTAAEKAGQHAYDTTQALDPVTTNMDTLGHSLQCMGLARLMGRNADGAKECFQQASRLSNGQAGLAALVNLGNTHFWLPEREGCHESDTRGPFPLLPGSPQRLEPHRASIDEALACWNDVVDTLQDETNDGTEKRRPSDVPSGANSLLRIIALNNIAEGQCLVGNKEGEDKHLDAGEEALVQALRIWEEAEARHSETSASQASFLHAKSRTLTILGRCKREQREAVTAEGLFRAALDDLDTLGNNPVYGAQESQRINHDRCYALALYGDLLSDWEKRESDAARLQAEADECMPKSLQGLPFGSMIPMPMPFSDF